MESSVVHRLQQMGDRCLAYTEIIGHMSGWTVKDSTSDSSGQKEDEVLFTLYVWYLLQFFVLPLLHTVWYIQNSSLMVFRLVLLLYCSRPVLLSIGRTNWRNSNDKLIITLTEIILLGLTLYISTVNEELVSYQSHQVMVIASLYAEPLRGSTYREK